jgi:hypothetical protein
MVVHRTSREPVAGDREDASTEIVDEQGEVPVQPSEPRGAGTEIEIEAALSGLSVTRGLLIPIHVEELTVEDEAEASSGADDRPRRRLVDMVDAADGEKVIRP